MLRDSSTFVAQGTRGEPQGKRLRIRLPESLPLSHIHQQQGNRTPIELVVLDGESEKQSKKGDNVNDDDDEVNKDDADEEIYHGVLDRGSESPRGSSDENSSKEKRIALRISSLEHRERELSDLLEQRRSELASVEERLRSKTAKLHFVIEQLSQMISDGE